MNTDLWHIDLKHELLNEYFAFKAMLTLVKLGPIILTKDTVLSVWLADWLISKQSNLLVTCQDQAKQDLEENKNNFSSTCKKKRR